MRKLPPLTALRAFEAAARHLSFKTAANELGLTPTAISHQVRLLEEICRRPLFRRRPRPIALTTVGVRLFPVIRNGFDAFAAALSEAKEGSSRQPLRVTTTNAFASRWLVPCLPLWRAAQPQIARRAPGAAPRQAAPAPPDNPNIASLMALATAAIDDTIGTSPTVFVLQIDERRYCRRPPPGPRRDARGRRRADARPANVAAAAARRDRP
ncbi:MAG TPA: LysR family transcriptional regulator [Stellaceae bacterium]|nr:LysR family transcriptional regulator [Stellaceae bacterium]HMD66204.1 LysR family transcriptional regulator [Stellaceae bacterium]